MNSKFLLFYILAMSLYSCSNNYKITQTPDDVYYSPARLLDEDVINSKKESSPSNDDRVIIMSNYDRRWRNFNDDYNYAYDPYHYGYNYGYYYNPYYYPFPVYLNGISPANPKNTTPRTTNLSSYTFHNTATANPKSGPIQFPKPGRNYNNSNYDNNREILTPNRNSSSSDTRTYSPSSNSGGSSGSSIVRPAKG